MGPVRAAQPLDRAICPPPGFEQEVNALALVLGVEAGVVGSAGAACVAEDENGLATVHEVVGFGLVGPRRACFQLLAAVALRDETLGPSGHLRHALGAVMLDDAVKGGLDRRQGAEMLDQALLLLDRERVVDRAALVVEHRHRAFLAGVVDEDLHLLRREGAFEIVDHVFFAVAVYVERGGGRRSFPSVFHDFTPDNYSSFDLNKSKEATCEHDHHCRFERPRSGSKTRPVTAPYSPHSSPLCRSTRGQPVRFCLALLPAISCIGWNCMGSRSA